MKRFLFLFLVLVVMAGAVRPVAADLRSPEVGPVANWNGLALEMVRATRASDADAACSYVMVNAAVYDAVNGITARRDHRDRAHLLRSPDGAPPLDDQQAAACWSPRVRCSSGCIQIVPTASTSS